MQMKKHFLIYNKKTILKLFLLISTFPKLVQKYLYI